MKKERADHLLHEQGLAESREKAKRLIMAGQVLVVTGDRVDPVRKAGQFFSPDTHFRLKEKDRFVSRGGYKLLTAIEHFGLDVRGKVCLDGGASTGGFTDCLLQHGAARVYAVDVGRNQLHEKLRRDPRVVSMEGINLREAGDDLLSESVDLVTLDCSFISLTLILPSCIRFLKESGEVVALVKPQFELGPQALSRGGVVRSEEDREKAVKKISDFAGMELGLHYTGAVPSALKGPKGNQEFLLLFTT